MAADTVALLDHLGWVEPVRIAGHSMGGWIAETLVLDHPERVRSAALMGSANAPTAWEIAITTVERDLARLDYDLPPLFYATETLRYLPIADIQDTEVVSTWLSMMGDLPVVAQPRAARASTRRPSPGRPTRPAPPAGPRCASPAWCWPSSTTSTRRRATPARRPRPSRAATTARSPARGTSASSPTPTRCPPPGRVLRRRVVGRDRSVASAPAASPSRRGRRAASSGCSCSQRRAKGHQGTTVRPFACGPVQGGADQPAARCPARPTASGTSVWTRSIRSPCTAVDELGLGAGSRGSTKRLRRRCRRRPRASSAGIVMGVCLPGRSRLRARHPKGVGK